MANPSGRAKKSGIGFQIEKKMEERYDAEDEKGVPVRIIDWINAILNGEHQRLDYESGAGIHWQKINLWMKDGILLCKLINKLLASASLPPVKYSKKANTAFVVLENIETFNKGAKAYGVPETALFQSIDLHEGLKGPFLNVINCINKLGFVANEKGFEPKYEAVEAPRESEAWNN